jgi:uncharacterized protein YbjT (DUF2867 family)
MKIAVTTPTGHIGSKVAEILLDWSAKVVLLVRDPAKVQQFVDRGAEVKKGSIEDSRFLTDALRGVDSLFWLTPPNMQADDLNAYQKRLGDVAAKAIRDNNISRVVNLSSIGAHLGPGFGPISGLHDVEESLNSVSANITHLRCGFFYENFLYQLENIRTKGSIYMTMSGSTRLPMIATRDIAEVAAQRLLDGRWSGKSVRGLHGPVDLSLFEAAGQISEGLSQQVKYQRVPEDAARKAMMSMGVSSKVVDSMLEMYRAMDSGSLKRAEPRSPETTTPTTLVDFSREVIQSLLLQPVHA